MTSKKIILKLVVKYSILVLGIEILVGLIQVIFSIPESFTIDFIFNIVSGSLIIFILYNALKNYFKEDLFFLFNSDKHLLRTIFIAFLLSIIVVILNYVLLPLSLLLPEISFFEDIYKSMLRKPKTLVEYVFMFLSMTILTAIIEETFMRGFIYNISRKKFNVTVAIILSTIIFYMFHLNPQMILFLIVANTALCLSFEYSKSLIMPILLHSFINMFQIINHLFLKWY